MEPFFELAGHYAIDLPGARVVFTTRRGGYSEGPYRSLNLGVFTDDDPEAVSRNRAVLRADVAAPPLSFVHQVHGTEVRRVEAGGASTMGRHPPPKADGQATATPGVAPTALVADCLPVAVAGGGAVAMLHGGWRGLAGGIIAEGVRALRELGAEGALAAAIGPGAGGCCYEAGPEVHEAFADIPAGHRGAHIDLKAVARHRLAEAGVEEVSDLGMCTICSDPDLLFSHRRDHGVTGRQAGVAWLT